MAIRLNPYLSFDGNAREAMTFYQGVFGGSLTVSTFGEFGMSDPAAEKVMHGMLEADGGLTLMGADVPPGSEYTPGNAIAISLSGDDADALRRYWDELTDGGSIDTPLEKQMWGDEFGMCSDRYGIAWMVNIATPPA